MRVESHPSRKAKSKSLLIAVDAIPDTFSTVLNVTGNLAATALVARRQSRHWELH